jgi:hypothetical protein
MDFSDNYTPDASEAISSMSTIASWAEFYTLSGIPSSDSFDKTHIQFPTEIAFLNEKIDELDSMNYHDAFMGAFTNCQSEDGQFQQYLSQSVPTPEDFARPAAEAQMPEEEADVQPRVVQFVPQSIGWSYHTWGKLNDLLEEFKERKVAEYRPDVNDDHKALKPQEEELLTKLQGDNEKIPILTGLLHTTDWRRFITFCCKNNIYPLFTLRLFNRLSAKVSMLLALVPGLATIGTFVGNINATVGFDAINKYLTNNVDFKMCVPVFNPRAIDSIPAAFIHEIMYSNSQTGKDFVNDDDFTDTHSIWSTKQFIVVPVFPDDPAYRNENAELVSTTGYFAAVVSEQSTSTCHFKAAKILAMLIRGAGSRIQAERPNGLLENFGDDADEYPLLAYRAHYKVRVNNGKKDSWRQCSGQGPRGGYVFPKHRVAWSSGKEVKPLGDELEMRAQAFTMTVNAQ